MTAYAVIHCGCGYVSTVHEVEDDGNLFPMGLVGCSRPGCNSVAEMILFEYKDEAQDVLVELLVAHLAGTGRALVEAA